MAKPKRRRSNTLPDNCKAAAVSPLSVELSEYDKKKRYTQSDMDKAIAEAMPEPNTQVKIETFDDEIKSLIYQLAQTKAAQNRITDQLKAIRESRQKLAEELEELQRNCP